MTAKKGRPTIRERAAERLCPNCGKPSPQRRSKFGQSPLYCRPEDNDGRDCKRELGSRHLADGLSLVAFVKAWRIDRGQGEIAQESLKRLCQIADDLNDTDRQKNRPRADYYAAVLLASNIQTVPELRYGRRMVERTKREQEDAEAVA